MSRLGPLAIACIALPLLGALFGASGHAQAQADAQVADLNSQGIEAYQGLDMEVARAKLEEALGVAQQNGLGGPVVAQVYMNLGVVQIAGFNDRDQGLAAFVSALCMQPDVQLDPLLSTPDVQQAFAQAQQDAAAGACGPGTAPPATAPQLMPQQAPYTGSGPQVGDLECPPGVVCGEEGGDGAGPKDFARFFVNLQLVGAFTYVTSGLEADSKPPISEVLTGFFNDVNGDGVVERMRGFDENTGGLPIADEVLAGDDRDDQIDINGDNVPDMVDYDQNGMFDNRFYFNLASPWVPDKDSFDDYEDAAGGVPRARTPVPGTCEADGNATGPLDAEDADGLPFPDYVPSKYCVRVEQPGVVSNIALRLNPGYFITDGFALSLPLRIQFNSGEGTMSNMLIGLRGELLFSEQKEATGFPVSFFFGATYGQIQAQPPPKNPARPAPFVTSGPFGAHVGVNVRWRLHRNFGLILAPELDLQFPALLFNADMGLGVEGAF
jgi:hypothetical protein